MLSVSKNSSARVLPENTVLSLPYSASVGYVVVMGRPMATSQDFVNWVCSKHLDHNFLKYLFIAEDEDLLRFASGSVHQTIYFPEVKAFHICHPPLSEQQQIVSLLDQAFSDLGTAKANAQKNLLNARALFESHLQSVFTQRGNGWVEKSLEEVADANCSLSYGIVQPGEEHLDGLPVVRPTDLTMKVIRARRTGSESIPNWPEGYKAFEIHPAWRRNYCLCVRGSTGNCFLIAAPELFGADKCYARHRSLYVLTVRS